MEKDFDAWNEKKKRIHQAEPSLFFMERDIWLCKLGLNIGSEQDGKGDDFLRPAVVLRKFNGSVLWIIPLTRIKKRASYYFPFSFQPQRLSTAILSQVKLIDVRRLKRKIGTMSRNDFQLLKEKFRALLP
jgi:mRNA interferase MazF